MTNQIEVMIKEETGRIDKVLNDRLADYSRSQIQQWIKEQHVSIEGKVIKANYKVNAGDKILIEIPGTRRIGSYSRKSRFGYCL